MDKHYWNWDIHTLHLRGRQVVAAVSVQYAQCRFRWKQLTKITAHCVCWGMGAVKSAAGYEQVRLLCLG